MSETRRFKGKLKLINRYNKTLEELCEELTPKYAKEDFKYWNSYTQFIEEEMYDTYIIHKGEVYKIEKEEVDVDFEICEGHKNNDNTIDFHVMFYDGGTCLSEMLEEVLDKVY